MVSLLPRTLPEKTRDIRRAEPGDIPAVVRVHQASFPNFFLSQLGPAFLQAYYDLVLRFEYGIILVSEECQAIDGFCAGFLYPSQFYQRMSASKMHFALPILRGVLANPRCFSRVVRRSRRVADQSQQSPDTQTHVTCELSSIAVDPVSMGVGLGKALLLAFQAEAQARGAEQITLTTDADNNERVNHFYQRMGFTLSKSYVADEQRVMNEYHLILETSPTKESLQ